MLNEAFRVPGRGGCFAVSDVVTRGDELPQIGNTFVWNVVRRRMHIVSTIEAIE